MRRRKLPSNLFHRLFRRSHRSDRWISFESLEDRTVPAVVLWDGGAGTTNWQDALNWSTDALPGTTDDVRILGAGSTVNLSSGFANVASVLSDRSLNITGGSLAANSLQVNNSLVVGLGGEIQNAKILAGTGSASVTFSGGSIFGVELDAAATASGGISFYAGLVLNNRLTLTNQAFGVGTQSITGNGDIYFAASPATLWSQGDGTAAGAAQITIGSGITIHGSTNGALSAVNPAWDRFINNGTINADTASRTITVSNIDNQGIIKASTGTIVMSAGWKNSGSMNVTGASGTMTLNSAADSWTNTGSLNLLSGKMNLTGIFTQASLGTLNRSGGTLQLTGTISGGFTLNGDFTIGTGGTLKNGTYSFTDGTVYIGAGVLDNVTLGCDLTMFGYLTVKNGLNLNSHLWKMTNAITVTFAGTQAISGPGEIRLDVAGATMLTKGDNSAATASLVTIAPGVVVHGLGSGIFKPQYASYDRWINQGIISSDTAGNTWTISNIDNQGTITSTFGSILLTTGWTNIGTIDVGGSGIITIGNSTDPWTNAGSFNLSSSGTINLFGYFTQSSLGTFNRTGGNLNVTGTLTGDFTISGGLTIAGGTLKDGSYLPTDGSLLTITSGTLDNVTLGTDLTSTGSITVKNGINLNNHRWIVNSTAVASVTFVGAQTISGPGEIQHTGSSWTTFLSRGGEVSSPSIVTIATEVLVNASGSIQSRSTYDGWINQGTIIISRSNQGFGFSNFVNQGTINISAGDVLWLEIQNFGVINVLGGALRVGDSLNSWTNAGLISLASGTINLDGAFTQASLGSFNRTGGSLNITGFLSGDLALSSAIGAVTLAGGSIKNSTYSSADGMTLTVTSGTLDNVTLGSDLTSNGSFTVKNGLKLNNHIWTHVASSNSTVAFVGTQTISGPGEIRINSTTPTTLSSQGGNSAATASIVTFGDNVFLHGTGVIDLSGLYLSYDRITNRGSIIADSSGSTVTFQNVDNYGLVALSGGNLNLLSDYTQYGGETRLSGANSAINGSTQTVTIAGGVLTGSGTISGNLTNQADISPGIDSSNSIGSITVGGSYTQQGMGRLIVDLAEGGLRDQLNVVSSANVDGALVINRRNDAIINDLATYSVLTSTSLSGTFNDIVNGNPSDSFSYNASYSPTSVTITSHAPLAPDLIVSGLTVAYPGGPYAGRDITIQWNDINGGSIGTTGGWVDRIYIVNTSGGVVLDTTVAGLAIAAGSSSSRSFTYSLPVGTPGIGSLVVTIMADFANTINEANVNGDAESNNSAITTTTTYVLPALSINGPVNITSGQSVDLSGTATGIVGVNSQYSWDINGDGIFGDVVRTSGGSFTVSWGTLSGLGINTTDLRTVRYFYTDNLGTSIISPSTTLTVNPNGYPSVVAGGPYFIYEGDSLTLSAIGTDIDPDQQSTLSYSWDIDGDGTYSDALGASPTLTWSELLSLGIIDGPVSKTISVRVADTDGLSSNASALLTINNAPPTSSASGATNIAFGSNYTLNLSASDFSPVDHVANFTYDIDWDGDGIYDQSIIANGTSVTHLYSLVGEYDIRVRATDHDGGTSSVQKVAVNVFGYMLYSDPLNPLITDLVWSGTSGADSVSFEQTGTNQISLHTTMLNNVVSNTTQVINGVTGRIFGLGQKGNDRLDASLLSTMSTELRGGGGADTILGGAADNLLYGDSDGGEGGNDSITGGASSDTIYADGPEGGSDTINAGGGNDVVFSDPIQGAEGGADDIDGGIGNDLIDAGTGSDTIHGNDGNDVIVAGSGADSLIGGLGEDLMISGTLAASFYSNQQQGIKQVAQQWQTNDSFNSRVGFLKGSAGGIVSSEFVLIPGTAVLSDSAVDAVITDDDGEEDWVLAANSDAIESDLIDLLDHS